MCQWRLRLKEQGRRAGVYWQRVVSICTVVTATGMMISTVTPSHSRTTHGHDHKSQITYHQPRIINHTSHLTLHTSLHERAVHMRTPGREV